jgi:hypothetical protein
VEAVLNNINADSSAKCVQTSSYDTGRLRRGWRPQEMCSDCGTELTQPRNAVDELE